MRKYMCLLMVVFVSVMSTSAFGVLDQSQTAVNSGVNPGSTAHFIGQGFTQGAGLNYLNSVEVRYYGWEANGDPDWVSVAELHVATTGTYDATSLVATSAATTTSSFTYVPETWVNWDFGSVAVTPGDGYTFIIKHTTGTWGPALSTAAPYAGGAVVNNNGGGDSYSNVYGQDLAFNTYSSVVPEPATMGLLSLGGLALLRKRRA
jgi:hypothetical protein